MILLSMSLLGAIYKLLWQDLAFSWPPTPLAWQPVLKFGLSEKHKKCEKISWFRRLLHKIAHCTICCIRNKTFLGLWQNIFPGPINPGLYNVLSDIKTGKARSINAAMDRDEKHHMQIGCQIA